MSGQDLIKTLKSGNVQLCPNCHWPLEHCACRGGKGVAAAIVSLALMALTWGFVG